MRERRQSPYGKGYAELPAAATCGGIGYSPFPMKDDDLQLATLAIRAGQSRTHEGEHSEPIIPTSSFVFGNAAEAAARFAEGATGNIYSRFTNPTVRCFEERLAALEGGGACVATASGMGAILALGMALLKAGDHVVCSDSVFGSIITLFNRYFVKFGVEVSYVRPDDVTAWERAIKPNTRLFFLETPSNPLSVIADKQAVFDLVPFRRVRREVDHGDLQADLLCEFR